MTLEQELTDPFGSAVAEAKTELGMTSPDEALPVKSTEETEDEVLGDEAVDEGSEQTESEVEPPAEQADEDSDELFGDLEAPEIEEVVVDDTPIEDQSFTLPGIDEPVSLQELKDGYLRQADYTRKTQALSAERGAAEKADALWKALTENGSAVARQLAEAAGLIEPGADPVRVVDLPFRSAEDIQAEVDQKIAEALESHPDLEAARDILAERWIETEFARIEEAHGTKLGPKSRDLILRTAQAKNVDDLEMVFQALLAKQQETARQRDSLKQAAPAKPTGKAMPQSVDEDIDSFEAAVAAAKAEIGI